MKTVSAKGDTSKANTHRVVSSRYTLALLLTLLVFAAPLVSADYNYWTQKGESSESNYVVSGTIQGEFTNVQPTEGTFGNSHMTALVFDLNGDGTNEILTDGGNNKIIILDGNNPSQEATTTILGDIYGNPVVCDVSNDGTFEFVFSYNNASGNFLIYLGLDESNALIQSDTYQLGDQMQLDGKMSCNKFYSRLGDPKNYVLFVDVDKYLYIAHHSGGSWIVQQFDDGGVADESGDSENLGLGSGDVLITDNFDVNGKKAAIYTAGGHLWVHFDNNQTDDLDMTGQINDISSQMFIGLMQTNTYDKVFFRAWIDGGEIGNGYTAKTSNFFGNSQLSLENTFSAANFCTLTRSWESHITLADVNGDGHDDVLDAWQIYGKQTTVGCGVGLSVLSGTNLSGIGGYGASAKTTICQNQAVPTGRGDAYYVDADGDGDKDVLSTCEYQAEGNSATVEAFYWKAPYYNTTGFLNGTSWADTSETNSQPVDYNGDGLLDLIVSSTLLTTFFQSSFESVTSQTFPFIVSLNHTSGLAATVKSTALFEDEEADYNTAVVCSVESNSIYTENFNLNYNSSTRNVSTNVVPLEDFLTFEGVVFTIGGNYSEFDLVKDHTSGVRDTMEQTIRYVSSTDRTFDLINYASDGAFTSYYRLNYTGGTLYLSKVVPFSGETSIANVSTGASIEVSIIYSPVLDTFSGQKYFDTEVYVNGNSVGTTSTAQFSGENILTTEVYTSDNGTFTLSNLALAQTSDLQPGFVQFQNGITTTIGDVTFTYPPLVLEVAGEGFTIIPDYNDVWYTLCEYEEAGQYTQRHYLAADNNVVDYSNYEEIRVTVGEDALGEDGFVGDYSNDPFLQVFDDYLSAFGLDSPAAKLFVAFLIIFISAAIGFYYSAIFGLLSGVLTLVLMVMFGFVPIWVIVVLGILAAAVMASMWKTIFGGD